MTKKRIFIILGAFFAILILVLLFLSIYTLGFVVGKRTTVSSSTANVTPTPQLSKKNIYFIMLNDNGKTGKAVGCGDSVVPVARNDDSVLAALRDLFNQHTQTFGTEKLYNALYQSALTVDRLLVSDEVASVYLTGTYRLGGVCDGPRFEAQIRETVMQVSTVKDVKIYLNTLPLDVLLSGQGAVTPTVSPQPTR